VLEINDITVEFTGGDSTIPALSSLSLNIKKNEYISLIGPNGSGKSTLLKAICGFLPLKQGSITFDGQVIGQDIFDDLLFGKIGVVFQEPSSQFLMPTVEKEILSVLQNLGLEIDEQQSRLKEIADLFSLDKIFNQSPDNLSGGQIQLVNLACALAIRPKFVLLDEPTTFLDAHYRKVLLDYLDTIYKSDIAVLHITQYPEEALRSKRVCLINNGAITADGPPKDIMSNQELMNKHRIIIPVSIRFEKSFGFPIYDNGIVDKLNLTGGKPVSSNESDFKSEHVISAKDISFRYDLQSPEITVDNLNLSSGEVTAVIGPTGAGKSTLAYLLSGLLDPNTGRIAVKNKVINDYSNKQLRQIIGISMQMPEIALIGPTVIDDVNMSLEIHKNPTIKPDDILSNIGLSGFENRIVDSLSGGESRKLSIADVLAAAPEYLILDEPAAFLDSFSQNELIKIIKNLARLGKGILVIGHELELISEIADRVLGMKDGRILFDIQASEFFNDPRYFENLELPGNPLLNIRGDITKKGIDLAENSIMPEKIAGELKNRGIL
jgi:energy-coupling factor transport system ATP-binding protein